MRRNPRNRPVTARDIASEALTLAGGGRALLLQIAHPAVGRGVVEHSDFATRLMDRFDGTMLYLTASMFGTADELRAIRRIVNRAHAPVRGGGSPGAAYNAYDPDLQLWVAATLYQTMMELHRRVFGSLSDAQADAVYQDMTSALSNLQLSPDRWPATRDAFDAYWSELVGTLSVDADVLAVSQQILYPAAMPWWFRPSAPLLRLVTAGLLPGNVRAQFRLTWNERRQRRFDRLLRWTRIIYPRLPLRLRHLPRDRYLAKLRRTVGGTGSTAPSGARTAD
ncbi:oxygenase MpaB family protein [Leifsonia sp. NPDC077715]|uniref:oxygenase MpaB family protein n=1 Tax=Leifsonia sp. NPDC077715 TaxID=3155539 RepID=UPI0034375ED2